MINIIGVKSWKKLIEIVIVFGATKVPREVWRTTIKIWKRKIIVIKMIIVSGEIMEPD